MLRSLISFIRAESAAYTTQYSRLVTAAKKRHQLCTLWGATTRRIRDLCAARSALASNFPWARAGQANADIKFREHCLSESQKKKKQSRKTQKLKRNTHRRQTRQTEREGERDRGRRREAEGQKEQQSKMAKLPFGLPDPSYNFSWPRGDGKG